MSSTITTIQHDIFEELKTLFSGEVSPKLTDAKILRTLKSIMPSVSLEVYDNETDINVVEQWVHLANLYIANVGVFMARLCEVKLKQVDYIRMRQYYTDQFQVSPVANLPEDVVGVIQSYFSISTRIAVAECKYEGKTLSQLLSILRMPKLRKMMNQLSVMYYTTRINGEFHETSRVAKNNQVKQSVSKFMFDVRKKAFYKTVQRKNDCIEKIVTIYETYRDIKCPTKYIDTLFRKRALMILEVIYMTYEFEVSRQTAGRRNR
jgi:hypothetical protein